MVGGHDGVRGGSIPSFGNGGSIPPSLKPGGLAELGLMQGIANPPMHLSVSVGSNPTSSAVTLA